MEAWSDDMKYRLGTWNDWEFGRSRATLDIHHWSVNKGKFTPDVNEARLQLPEGFGIASCAQGCHRCQTGKHNVKFSKRWKRWHLEHRVDFADEKNSTRSGTVLVDLGLAFHPWSPWAARVECWLGASGKTWKLGSEKRRDLGKLRCQVECLRLETSRKVAQHGISFDRSMMAGIN